MVFTNRRIGITQSGAEGKKGGRGGRGGVKVRVESFLSYSLHMSAVYMTGFSLKLITAAQVASHLPRTSAGEGIL